MSEFKKKMKEKIKIYSKEEYYSGYLQNEFLTDDNDADIFLHLTDIDQLIDNRTVGNQVELTNDFYDFVEQKSSVLNNDVKIELHISGLKLSNKEQGMVKHIVKEHYGVELHKVQKRYLQCRDKIIHLFTFGFLIALLYFLLITFTDANFEFGFEVLSFVFSFALWEAFDAIIYSLNDIKYEREEVTQNLLMNITFED